MNDHPTRTHYSGIDGTVGGGWLPILETLCTELTALGWEGKLRQVKEKFGQLRFYAVFPDTWPEETRRRAAHAIIVAEWLSLQTCESCGNPGLLRGEYWKKTRCDTCASLEET